MTAVRLPDGLRERVPRYFGAAGERWLAAAPALAEQLARRWGLRFGPPYPGGSHALVLPADRPGDGPLVLKLPVVDDENYAEAAALRAYAGDGAVRLIDHDPPTGALLLERAEPGTSLAGEPDRDAALDRALALWRRLRRPPPDPAAFPAATALAARWAKRFATTSIPGLEEPVERAAALAADFAARPDGPPLLVNRDAHLDNVLRTTREWCLVIDPKPVAGEPAFDGAHPVIRMLEDGRQHPTAPDALARIATGLAVDPTRLWAWTLLRALENVTWQGAAPDEALRARRTVDALWHARPRA